MDYTNRDFVALAGLGIEREDRPIELELSKTGLLFAEQLKRRLPVGVPVLGLNIGCGTPDAFHKRPDMAHLVECLGASLQGLRHSLVLSGAAFERDINQEFMARYAARWGDSSHMLDLGGETSLDTLTGLIEVCDVFISTDSGPYHMAVAMKKPTLVWLTYAEVTSFHKHPWCRTLIQPTTDQFKKALTDLMPPLIVTS
jgi:ADP-heptose:LPS heptosyltransferase